MQRRARGPSVMKQPQPPPIQQERRPARGPLAAHNPISSKQASSPTSSTNSALSGDGAICPDSSGFVSFKLEDIKMVDFGSEPVSNPVRLLAF